jgi:hypothetical protein
MGDYYFAMRSGLSRETLSYLLKRPVREVATKFHLRHPWYVPVKLLGELRAFGAAVRGLHGGPRLLDATVLEPAPGLPREQRPSFGCRRVEAAS